MIGFERSFFPPGATAYASPHPGNGGALREAVRFVLHKLGIPYRVVSRKLQAGTSTYADLDESVIRSHTLIINTTPLGTFPEVETYPDIPYSFLSKTTCCTTWFITRLNGFFTKGEAAALPSRMATMLLIQAEESWRIWNENQD